MTIKSGTGQACAACKYQRRRCTPECLLAPFFPADQPKSFHNVHRLFGVKHVQNLLKEIAPEQRLEAMRSIKYHAGMRDRFPVLGCLHDIQKATYQIQLAEEELNLVYQQLAYYRQLNPHQQEISPANDYVSQLQLGIEPSGDTVVPTQYTALPITPQASYSNNNVDYNNHPSYLDSNENNNVVDPIWNQETYDCDNSNNSENVLMAMQSQLAMNNPVQHEVANHQDFKEVHSFFNNIDQKPSYVVSTEAYESSLESSMKDSRQTIEHMSENELKSAAACFSLTSVN